MGQPSGKGKRLVILHAITKDGFLCEMDDGGMHLKDFPLPECEHPICADCLVRMGPKTVCLGCVVKKEKHKKWVADMTEQIKKAGLEDVAELRAAMARDGIEVPDKLV